ncbi:MAG TPA: UDP-N-acetylmuramoyl-L-alanine--D-glutamate ligase [Candidatus Andersenbacteria bacterium]|nr:MAG: UDP-N-acetylmuramoylalanine-D-glutamate ligase [Parcubacteria group bacterium GW2011_GWA2_45_14]HBE89800.1 UDP-N-acetylmuramoyl-L-alanine--D-glutamate ligase [Candidatus Andersenbacteria bacterium]
MNNDEQHKAVREVADLKGTRITVMGLGEHGGALGNIKWLREHGAQLIVTDLKSRVDLQGSIEQLGGDPGIEWVLGKHREKDFTETDLVIMNPAVSRRSPYLELARGRGVKIEMDSSLFFQWFDKKRIIGVTGSKGKSTTTAAIGQVLDVKIIGVEGTAPLAGLDQLGNDEQVVFELSSWRLEPLDRREMSPGIAVVTSIYRDHLNTYDSWAQYIDTKKTLVKYQGADDLALLNFDDKILRDWAKDLVGRVGSYSLKDYQTKGIFIENDQVVVRWSDKEEIVMAVQDLPVRHAHEVRNLLPAILLAWQQGMSKELIRARVQKVRLLPHRMEKVAVIDAVEYINDSAATMPDATIAALDALSSKQLIHILGGNDKDLEFGQWAERETQANIKAMIWLPGNASDKMRQAYQAAGGTQTSEKVKDMTEAVKRAAAIAQAGEVVLLSPGATSFGSFKNEFDRGNRFKAAVHDLSGN